MDMLGFDLAKRGYMYALGMPLFSTCRATLERLHGYEVHRRVHRHVYRHVHRHVRRHVHRCVHRHVYRHVHRHVQVYAVLHLRHGPWMRIAMIVEATDKVPALPHSPFGYLQCGREAGMPALLPGAQPVFGGQYCHRGFFLVPTLPWGFRTALGCQH